MSDAVIAALITGGAAVVGQYLISKANADKTKIDQAKRDQHLDDQLADLTERVDEHNSYAKMFADMTTTISLIAQDVSYLKEGIFKNENTK